MRPRVYISGPITNGGKATAREALKNVKVAFDVGEELIKVGYAPLIPHLTFFLEDRDISWEEWLDLDLPWVAVCEAVYRLPGESAGADKEVLFAESMRIPVVRSLEELKEEVPL